MRYSVYLSHIKFKCLILCLLTGLQLAAQVPSTAKPEPEKPKEPYMKKEEIIYDGKRYRIYNNYLTVGVGALASTIRANAQKTFAFDYQFHIKRNYVQAGLLMSGDDFLANNDVSLHACYGFREEGNLTNVTIFGGPSIFTGVTGTPGVTAASVYNGVGAYFDFQAVLKYKYDLGLGFEIFAELSEKRNMGGIKLILFFSSAYKGIAGAVNKNVRINRK